jgi:hypothetical protein
LSAAVVVVVVVVVISGWDMRDASRYHHMAYTTSILLYKSCTSLAQMTFFQLVTIIVPGLFFRTVEISPKKTINFRNV